MSVEDPCPRRKGTPIRGASRPEKLCFATMLMLTLERPSAGDPFLAPGKRYPFEAILNCQRAARASTHGAARGSCTSHDAR